MATVQFPMNSSPSARDSQFLRNASGKSVVLVSVITVTSI
jgi:hypothetical protein